MYDMAHVLGLRGAALPAAVRRRRRPRHRLHPQDVLRHRSAASSAAAWRGGDERYPALGGGRAAGLPRRGQQPPPGHAARPAHGGLRDERLQRRVPAGGARQRQGVRPGARRRGHATWPATPRSATPRPTRSIVEVGYGRGIEIAAQRLEDNNIVCNYQATPDDEGFTAAGALRLGSRRDDPLRHGAGRLRARWPALMRDVSSTAPRAPTR